MSLRGPPATLRKTWRRSTDESYWDNFPLGASTPSPDRGSRPQSAVEGGQLDGWLKHLQRIQKTQIQVHVGQFGLQDKAARAKGSVPSSWGSSSGGTSLCGSSLGSQESLQTSAPSPPERRESWEKARISQPPKKEQSRVSFLTPVKIGWLPIRKKVTMVGEQGRGSHPSTQQVKLKPPITPTVMNTTSSSAKSPEGEEQRSQGKANGGLRTAWKNQDPAINKQGPERHFPAVTGGDGPVSWQSLKRGWRLNRVLALPGSSPNNPDQTPEDVLALNAAAIIANIKLQRKLSKKKTPSGKSENGSSPSPQDHCAVEDPAQDSAEDGNSETKARTAAFVPLSSDIQRSTPNMSLQEALLRSRPDLISRSKRRTEDLQRRVHQRRWTNSQSAQTGNTGKRNHLLKTRRQQPTSKWPTELQRRQEEEARREENLSNRQRADLFKKKLLDQVLQRGKD